MTKIVRIAEGVQVGGTNPLALITGPCVIESEKSALHHAGTLKKLTERSGVPFIFKSSYDKANRTSISSFRGPGLKEGLKILAKVKKEFNIPILSDVHCKEDVAQAAEVLDVIQIPALLCRQTDLIIKAAETKKVLNLKKGQFLSPYDFQNAVKKAESAGTDKLLLTERGTAFGYNNLVSDFRSVVVMKKFGYPVIYDAGHSVQIPGGLRDRSGGMREFIPPLIAAAVAVGSDGIFIEVHEKPDAALCDGPNMISLKALGEVLELMKAGAELGRRFR